MKKILILHHCGDIGGAGISLLHIVQKLNKKEYEISIACPMNPEKMIDLLKNEKCKIIPLEKNIKIFAHYNGGISNAISFKTFKNLISILLNKKYVKKIIIESNADIVIVNSMTLCWCGKIIKKLDKIAICFHRETYQKGLCGIRSAYIKKSLDKWFDKVFFISRYDMEATPKKNKKKYLLHDKVDIKAFNKYSKNVSRKKLNLDERTKYILYLGGFSELKGGYILVQALKYINYKNYKLVFVGDFNSEKNKEECKIKNKIKKYIEKYKLEKKICFVEKTENPEILYKACDLIVFPSTKAHQARPIYEAGISKIPIIITDFKETIEFAEDRKTAITFKNKDVKDLAIKIDAILNESIKVDKMVKINYKNAITNHNLDKLNIINELIRKY